MVLSTACCGEREVGLGACGDREMERDGKWGEGLIIQNTFSYSPEEVWGLHRMCVMSFSD